MPWSPSTSSDWCCPLVRPRSQPTALTATSLLGLPCSPGMGGSSPVRTDAVVRSLATWMGPRSTWGGEQRGSFLTGPLQPPAQAEGQLNCCSTQWFSVLRSLGGEGSSQVRLDGVAKIRITGDRQDRSGLRLPECPVCLTFTCSSVNSSSGLLT